MICFFCTEFTRIDKVSHLIIIHTGFGVTVDDDDDDDGLNYGGRLRLTFVLAMPTWDATTPVSGCYQLVTRMEAGLHPVKSTSFRVGVTNSWKILSAILLVQMRWEPQCTGGPIILTTAGRRLMLFGMPLLVLHMLHNSTPMQLSGRARISGFTWTTRRFCWWIRE
ncbi:uncharacterized protein [Ptychodera flava]|uniref:uncharacterized protein isoform X3 n=1 Tax=Ptychodera flava TaxID=63121 RepID=UPI00396A52FE